MRGTAKRRLWGLEPAAFGGGSAREVEREAGPPIYGTRKRSGFSTNAQSRFASVVLDGVRGPPHLECHTRRCPCISVFLEAMHEAS